MAHRVMLHWIVYLFVSVGIDRLWVWFKLGLVGFTVLLVVGFFVALLLSIFLAWYLQLDEEDNDDDERDGLLLWAFQAVGYGLLLYHAVGIAAFGFAGDYGWAVAHSIGLWVGLLAMEGVSVAHTCWLKMKIRAH